MAAVAPLLETRALVKRFGGVSAVDGVDLTIDSGGIHALIGSNGAGKSTLVGLICGRLAPSSGRVHYQGRDITAMPAWRRVTEGIVYTFQSASLFKELSCYENVALPVQRRLARGWHGPLAIDPRRLDAGVAGALAAVGLAEHAAQPAAELAYGHQRLLELAMALAAEPRLLILDEPTQGLSQGEIEQFCALLRSISQRVTVLLIEHNMTVVLSLAQRVTVMDAGAIIADGSPAQIEADPAVQKAYLGR